MFICTAAQIALLQLTWNLTVHKAKAQQGGRQRDEDGVERCEVKRKPEYNRIKERWLPDLRLWSNERVFLH